MSNEPAGPSNGTPRLDDVFSALADDTRRHVLRTLQSASEPVVPVGDLVSDTTAWDGPPGDPAIVAIELRHITLPKLDDAGLIDYDKQADTVRYQEWSRVEEILCLVSDLEADGSTNTR